MTKVSIIITLYNYQKYIRECLESVRNQTYEDWECIVIDTTSADGLYTITTTNGPAILMQPLEELYQMRMANDPIYAKVYWKDVLGQKTTWSGDDNQKQQLRLKLAEKSIEIARERNGTQSAKFTDVKIYAPKNNNSKRDKNKPNTSTVTIRRGS